jgi:hypothetical protein
VRRRLGLQRCVQLAPKAGLVPCAPQEPLPLPGENAVISGETLAVNTTHAGSTGEKRTNNTSQLSPALYRKLFPHSQSSASHSPGDEALIACFIKEA